MDLDLPLTDEERFPLITEAGRKTLKRLREHPHAPRYNYFSGERLSPAGLANVRVYAARLRQERPAGNSGLSPPWLPEFLEFCRREVPFHRRRDDWSQDLPSLAPLDRESLRREPWSFVPDSAPLDDLVVYNTSGTSGQRLSIYSHPEVPNRYLPLIEAALAACGVKLVGGDRVSIVQVSAQTRCYVLSSVMSYLDFAGFAKVNLNPAEWRDPADRVRFLDDCNPEIYTGDPFAFSELIRLPLTTQPKALVSSGTALLPGLRKMLETHFACPVVDLYSLNESGPVAFSLGGGHQVLPPDLLVEVLDPAGRPCPPGKRGEITLTGGNNPFLPLVRYRTGDHAALDLTGPLPVLTGLEGRPPILFRDASGRCFNSIDVSTALTDLPLACFTLHQASNGALLFRGRADEQTLSTAEARLRDLFGAAAPLSVQPVPESLIWSGKSIQYTSEFVPS